MRKDIAMRYLLTGNEAIALAFYINGGQFASGYPGTPSTEILENLSKYSNSIHSEWAPNEKVAVESAIGASYAGVRSIAVMKHVGVNVAADPIFTVAYTGINAGLIIITADDPGIHSSQNEQDNRHYAKSAKVPMFEPANSQECFDFVSHAFKFSEQYQLPVFIRLTTRVCHSKSIVITSKHHSSIHLSIDKSSRFDPIPSISIKLHKSLEHKLLDIANSNSYYCEELTNSQIGIITSGMSYNYVKEVLGNSVSILKLNLIFPLPINKVKQFCSKVERIFIVEELDPFIEEAVKALGINCIGKDYIKCSSELNPHIIRKAFFPIIENELSSNVPATTSKPFCPGCFYNTFFDVLSSCKNVIISSDIGCYSMSGQEPYKAKDIAICMGAGFSIAHGIQKSLDMLHSDQRVIGLMGDSTFFHSGITSLINCIYNNSNPILIILDNQSTSMTGMQDNPGTGYTLAHNPTTKIDLVKLLDSLNVKNIRTFNPFNKNQTIQALDYALSLNELVVLIAQGYCTLKLAKSNKKEASDNA